SGKVTSVRVKEGDKISVGQVLLSVEEEGRRPAGAAPARTPAREAREEPSKHAREETSPPEEAAPQPAESPEPLKEGGAAVAAPSIRKIARELGIDLHRVRGSERGGRIVM